MNELSEEMYKLWSDIVNHKGNAEEKALKYLDKIEQTSAQEFKNAYPLDMWESRIERDLHSIADALPESKAVALKMTEFTDKRLEELYGNWCLGSYKNLAEKLLSQHPDDENLADKWFSIAQKGLDYIQKRGSNWGDHQFLEILTVIKDNTPNSNKYDALIANIVNNREKTGEEPVLLLDDVLAELDNVRQNYLLRAIDENTQTIITSVDTLAFDEEFLSDVDIVNISQGQIV